MVLILVCKMSRDVSNGFHLKCHMHVVPMHVAFYWTLFIQVLVTELFLANSRLSTFIRLASLAEAGLSEWFQT